MLMPNDLNELKGPAVDPNSPECTFEGRFDLNVGNMGICVGMQVAVPGVGALTYTIYAGRVIECQRQVFDTGAGKWLPGVTIFGVDSFMDPQEPTDSEAIVCSMVVSPWTNFDFHMIKVAAGLSRLYHNNADQGHVSKWLSRQMGVENDPDS